MPTPPRAILARLVAFSLVATALPLVPARLAPIVGSAPAAQSARGAILQQFSGDGHAPVGPGVDHTWGRIVTGSGQQVVHMVTIAPAAPGITIEAGLSNDTVVGLEKSSSLANRNSQEGHRALASINGDVWSASSSGALAAPFGLHIQGGELMVASSSARPTFGIDAAGRPIIGAPVVSTNLLTPDGAFHEIARINQRRQASELALYTPRFGAQTDPDASGTEVVLGGVPLPLATTVNAPAVVQEVRPASGGTPIAPGTVVVTGPSTSFLAALVPGEAVTLTVSITAEWQGVTQAIGGREFLLRGGSTFISPHPDLADQRHPRTGIGITADGGVILATVDGRDAGYSTGVTDAEFAALLAERGAVDAINLDGGGSTAMAVREPGDGFVSIVNRPSDGVERFVTNSLLVFSAAPTGPLASITVTPDNQTVLATRRIDFDVFGQDAAYNPVTLPSSAVQWSVTGVEGTFDGSGGFIPTTAGTATITATAGGFSDSVRLVVVADSSPPRAAAPQARIILGTTLGATIPVNVSWDAATDAGLGVAGYELQQNINAKGWTTYPSGSALNRHAAPTPGLARNANYRFSVQASDAAGNASAWASGPSFRAVVLSEASSSIHFSKGWSRATSPSYDGRAAMSTRTAGASATYSFVGNGFAWVAAKSPVRGLARVYVDGHLSATVSTYAKTPIARRIVYAASWAAIGRHTVKIVVLGTPGHPRVDLDALVVLASPTITTGPPAPPAPGPTPPPPPPPPTPAPTPTPAPSPSDSPSPSPSGGEAVLVGAGDIASCDLAADTATARVVGGTAGTVFTAGDNAYERGSAADYADCYGPTWGAFRDRTRPVPGNHEYQTEGAAGYFGYFGSAAGTPGQGWYAYDLAGWRIYALNSNCGAIGGCGPGSKQEAWLLADLRAHPRACIAAIWHHPRFSSGEHGDNPAMDAIWRDLVAAGAEFVVNGHDHDYERFAPLTASGSVAAVNGTREFVVGTGGASLRSFGNVAAGSQVRNNATNGVIAFTLTSNGYTWQFLPVAGRTFTDSGSGTCS